jgi:4-diphosphocytidyl-2-C-methyl-D-erythritol kinase
MFNKIDAVSDIRQEYNSQNVVNSLQNNNFELLSGNLYNIFEAVLDKNSEVHNIKELLIQNGAAASLMTGSGSAAFGLFNDKETAKKAYYNLKNEHETYYCISYNKKGR